MLDQHLRLIEEAIDKKDWTLAIEMARQLGVFLHTTSLFKISAPKLKKVGYVLMVVALFQQGRMK